MQTMKVALYQFTSLLDYKSNLAKVDEAAKQARAQGAQALFLAECFYSLSDGSVATPYLMEPGNEHYRQFQAVAKKNHIALIGGSAATLRADGKIVNRAYSFDAEGRDLGHYDKRHLFACDIHDKKVNEGKLYTPGSEAQIIDWNGWKIGVNICFDMRFSELALNYRKQGVNILIYPSAFTVPTGKAHWHVLLRARAIESQCYVIACAQWGKHNDRVQTYGHSLVVSPWGEVLLDLGEEERLACTLLDKTQVQETRKKVIMNLDTLSFD